MKKVVACFLAFALLAILPPPRARSQDPGSGSVGGVNYTVYEQRDASGEIVSAQIYLSDGGGAQATVYWTPGMVQTTTFYVDGENLLGPSPPFGFPFGGEPGAATAAPVPEPDACESCQECVRREKQICYRIRDEKRDGAVWTAIFGSYGCSLGSGGTATWFCVAVGVGYAVSVVRQANAEYEQCRRNAPRICLDPDGKPCSLLGY